MDLLGTANLMLRRYLAARGVASATANVGGHTFHHYVYRGTGSSPPAVLVHGLGSSALGFYKIIVPLGRTFSRLYAVDLPGNGFSPSPEKGVPTVEEQYDALVAFLEEVVREPAVLIGNSLGGAMAAKLAHEHPERVNALCLVAPAGARVEEKRMEEVLKSFDVQTTAEARALTRRLFHDVPLTALLMASELRKQYASETVRAFLRSRPLDKYLTAEALGSLQMPTLLLWGESEKVLPYESLDYFRAHLPAHAEIQVVKKFGHIPQIERPAELVERLAGFVERRVRASVGAGTLPFQRA